MTTSTEVAHETRFAGVRMRYDSDKSYDELLAAPPPYWPISATSRCRSTI
jgi:hypothetical protein